jgi:hypothetical protein
MKSRAGPENKPAAWLATTPPAPSTSHSQRKSLAMPKIPHARGRRKLRLSIQDVATHVADYRAETSPTKRRICERAFIRWFRIHAESGDPLAKELLADPNWMRRFPALTFNNFGSIDVDFIRRRLAVPAHLTDERDIFWRVRTNALGDVAQYLNAAYEKAVTWDADAERDILIDALMTVAKRDDWSASVCREDQKFWARSPHAIGSAAGYALTVLKCLRESHFYTRQYAVLEVAEALKGRSLGDAHRYSLPATLDALFRQVPDIEFYFREQARRPLRVHACEVVAPPLGFGRESELECLLRL